MWRLLLACSPFITDYTRTMSTFTYFAYGSNMLTSRLVARCASARAIGPAYADGYAFAYGKRSLDESAKGALFPSPLARAYGVLFTIDTADKARLDQFEGPGYWCRCDFDVIRLADETSVRATTYLAKERVVDLLPYDWYAALILAGAAEHGLLDHAPDFLKGLAWRGDPDLGRVTRLEAIELLKGADVGDPLQFLNDHQRS